MPPDAVIIFPHQLFEVHPSLSPGCMVFLVEDDRFFTDFAFHRKKLLLHRAAMQYYSDFLDEKGFRVTYIGNRSKQTTLEDLFRLLGEMDVHAVRMAEVTDHPLEERIGTLADAGGVAVTIDPSPAFLTSAAVIRKEFGGKEHYMMDHFYRHQRVRMNVLMEDGHPVGGKWSYDVLNRRPLPPKEIVPPLLSLPPSRYVRDAAAWVDDRYPKNPGSTEGFRYPVTHADARLWFSDFLEHRLARFGTYEDAIRREETFLYHSVLSPLLNTGLITPGEVVHQTLAYGGDHDTPLNSVEGFLRQVIGWREFVRAVYLCRGEEERRSNYWNHRRRLPSSFYDGTTGLVPVDIVVRRVLQHAFAHHIERLMVLGNIMCLAEIDPDDIHRWFMELFIDAYDWVMVPNVYGMSQYADGGLMSTKPYISSSNYIRRMSDIPEGEWCRIWDGLFWRFVEKNRKKISENYRMKLILANLDRKSDEEKEVLFGVAEEFLARL